MHVISGRKGSVAESGGGTGDERWRGRGHQDADRAFPSGRLSLRVALR